MKMTLRGLLAYLDDRLDPSTAAKVHDHIQDNDKVRQLIDRIKRVVRRRRLSTPDVAERQDLPPHHQDDPNEVAAFLDGHLSQEQEADFEQICIDTDVYLAEAAACHQIMTLGQQAVKVPPLARQRMYGLVEGPEAQPLRVVPRESRPSKPPLWEVKETLPPREDEENQAILEPLYHGLVDSRWKQGLIGIGALLLILLFAFVVWSIPWNNLNSEKTMALQVPNNVIEPVPEVVNKPEDVLENKQNLPVILPVVKDVYLWPVPVISIEGQPNWQSAVNTWSLLAGMMASRPGMPMNWLMSLGQESQPNEPVVPLPVLSKAQPRVPAAERNAHMPLGVNGAESLGMFLQEREDGGYSLVKPKASVLSNEMLIALPGYTANIALTNGLRIILMGQFSANLASHPVADARIYLHPSMDAAADMTLIRGCVIVQGRNQEQGSSLIYLRYAGLVWEITLPPGAEIGIQAGSRVIPGEGPWKLESLLDLTATKGNIEIRQDQHEHTLKIRQKLHWNSRLPEGSKGTLNELAELPVWLSKYQTAPREAVDSLVSLRSRMHAKLQQDGNDHKWFALACDEAIEEGKLIDRQAGLLGMTAVNRIAPLVKLQNDPLANGRRKYSHDVIQLWLNQEPGHANQLKEILKTQGYQDEDALLLLALYRGIEQPTPQSIQRVLQAMAHPSVAIREQAHRVLITHVPDRPNIFDPAGPAEQRSKAIQIIRNRLPVELQTGNETLPP